MLEAVVTGKVSAGNVARKQRDHPEVVQGLHLYQQQVERIPLMGVSILPLDHRLVLRSAAIGKRYGLLTNDSILATTALDAGIEAMASGDRDLERVADLVLYVPGDL